MADTEVKSDSKTLKKRGQCTRLAVGVGVIIFLATVAAFVVVLVLYVEEKSKNDEGNADKQIDDTSCDDIAIVGAGIAGSYAAWRLREKNLSITVYEYSNRIGGRLHTVHLPGVSDINIELGGMRFLPEWHPLMNKTAHDLGLSVVDFKFGMGIGGDTAVYLRGVRLKTDEIGGDKTPYRLKPNEKHKSKQQLEWELFLNGTDYNVADDIFGDENVRYRLKTKDGIELYKQSCVSAYTKIGASSEAVKFIRDVLGYYAYSGEISAAIVVPTRNPDEKGPKLSVKTVKSGMEQIPITLMEQFLSKSQRHHFLPLYDLRVIQRRMDGAYDLNFKRNKIESGVIKPTKTLHKSCARKVLLTVPRLSLEDIVWEGLKTEEIYTFITKSVKDVPATKVFLVYDYPWWRSDRLNISHAVTDLPNRQVYDFGTSRSSNKSVLLAAYVDMQGVDLWREFQGRGSYIDNATEASIAVSSEVVDAVHSYLAELYDIPVSSIPAPVSGTMSLWDQYPYGAGWHIWLPGFIWKDVQERMIKPSKDDEVYIHQALSLKEKVLHGVKVLSNLWSRCSLKWIIKMTSP